MRSYQPYSPYLVTLRSVLLIGLGLLAGAARAQQFKEASHFSLPEYYPPPNETQLKLFVEGAKAKPLDPENKRVLVSDVKAQNFRTNGTGEMVVQAPECLYDSIKQIICSDGALHAHTADGQFYIDGVGFLWQHAQEKLTVSNRVTTLIHPDAPAGNSTSQTNAALDEAKAITIVSDWFEYAANSGQGLYQRDVRLTGTNLSLTCDQLRIISSMKERRLENVVALTNVFVDYTNADHQEVHATGERASYLPNTGMIHLSGDPTWTAGKQSGRGDDITLDRTNRILVADGNAYLKMPGEGAGGASFLPQFGPPTSTAATSTKASPTTNHFVEVFSDHYVLQTNLAVFDRRILVRELMGDVLRGRLTCSNTLMVTFAGSNQVERLTAEDHVVIDQQEKQLTAERAVYTATNGLLTLTGEPAWRAGIRDGQGELILIHVPENEMIVSNDASMRMPAGQLSQVRLPGAKPTQHAQANLEGKFATVTAEEYVVKPGNAHFLRHVRIDHPEVGLTCEDLTVDLPGEGGQITNLVARQAVEFQLTDDRGQKVQGNGAQAVYTFDVTGGITNSIVVLTGDPVLITSNHVFRNDVIVYDLGNNRILGPGKYRFRGIPSLDSTNSFMARKKPRR